MLAIVAAIIFGIALLVELLNVALPALIGGSFLLFAGLLCVALHLAGIGSSARWRRR